MMFAKQTNIQKKNQKKTNCVSKEFKENKWRITLLCSTSKSNPHRQGGYSFLLEVFSDSSFLKMTTVINGGPVPIIEIEMSTNSN